MTKNKNIINHQKTQQKAKSNRDRGGSSATSMKNKTTATNYSTEKSKVTKKNTQRKSTRQKSVRVEKNGNDISKKKGSKQQGKNNNSKNDSTTRSTKQTKRYKK